MIKRSLAAATIAGLALGLSGCGKDSAAGNSASPGGTGGATIASQMIFGGPAEFQTRADGLPGLTKHYGVTFSKFITTDTGGPVTVTALKNGRIDAANLFTTDPSIKANDFVILTDPKSNFAAQNVTPIVNKAKATQGVKDVLNAISTKLTTVDLGNLVGAVQNDKKDPEVVAKQWLADHPLGTPANAASGATLTVGSANFPENVVLAWIYADALKAAGANISTKMNIGSREKYFPALKSGSIDVFPEYNGALLSYLDKNATATTTAEVDAALAKALPSNLEALKSSPAEDSDAIVVTKATAEKYNLTSIADLAKAAS
ncbi:glycine betaine ABC transporter substrate-binding protein [Branchiibius sp. NY16-3462-2]|uniref:glycine betaine ABC transporter substrate-binding protein n=1 Tax=Branchiibius sp. NY16-3462-2 TaxID=1807500 RepID=UPI0007984E3D|nr:glycine betaine ABC transporter substrate-binding protein [Branchiibius sp. NY16-3462-2]KYH43779.1 hypothetical protein AZH51_03005 [Branchiibius sp. NY16-3462-2]